VEKFLNGGARNEVTPDALKACEILDQPARFYDRVTLDCSRFRAICMSHENVGANFKKPRNQNDSSRD
jgi:hypothetical protein